MTPFPRRKHFCSTRFKVHGPDVVTLHNLTPIFKWYVARLVVKERHQKDMCYTGIEPCAQNMITIIGLILNTFRRVYCDHLRERLYRNLHFDLLHLLHSNSNSET